MNHVGTGRSAAPDRVVRRGENRPPLPIVSLISLPVGLIPAFVAAMSRALATLSPEIAAAVPAR